MTLVTRPVRLQLLSRAGFALPGARMRAQLSSYQVDGTDVVPLTWDFSEDEAEPGTYTAALWPNTRGSGGTQYLITADAGDQRMQAQLHTISSGASAASIRMMVNATPWPPVYAAEAAVNDANTHADAAGRSASLAMAYADGLGDVSAAVDAAQRAAQDAAESDANRLAFEDRVYPGIYSTPPTNKPHSGNPSAEGDRCTILVGGTAYEHLRSGGGWLIPNVDAVNLAAPGGAALVGGVRAAVGAQNTTLAAWLDRSAVFAFDFLTPVEIEAVKAGTAGDMRGKLQQAIYAAVGKRLVINAGAWKISPYPDGSPSFGLCLDIPDDSTIEQEPGAELQLLGHNHTVYQMMRVWDRRNVTIIRPRLNGRKDLNGATTGEYGMGIDIRGGSNIRVEYPETHNMWGDGIYIGETVGTGSPKNIYILKPEAKGCRRQGMSIVAGDGVVVDSALWSGIGGVLPGAGLDIEPNSNGVELKGIRIINPVTENCAGPGVLIALQLFGGPAAKMVDIVIEKHHDTGSAAGFSAGQANTTSNDHADTAGTYKIDGSIVNVDPVYTNSQGPAVLSSEHDARGPLITVVRPNVVDPNRNASSSPNYGSAFVALRDSNSTKTYPIGNLQIVEPTLTLTSGAVPKVFFFRDIVAGVGNLERIVFDNPRSIVGVAANNNGGFYGRGKLSDAYAQLGNEVGSSQFGYGSYGGLVATNASCSFELSVSQYVAGGPDITVRQPYSTSCIVRTGGAGTGTGNFIGLSVGQRLQAIGKPGAYLRLRPLGNNVFMIVENVGPWVAI